jgi:DNA-binding MarR family transcriptional regulator
MSNGIPTTPSEPCAYSAVDLTEAARRLDAALSQWHGELSERMGMSTSEVTALAHLAMEDDLGPSALAQRLHMTTGATTALLDRLAAHGHIVRERHPSDRRKVVVRLTPHAYKEALLQVRPMTAEIMDLAERLSPDERRTVGRFLDDLSALVRRQAGGSPVS